MNRIPEKQICEAWLACAELPSEVLRALLQLYDGARGIYDRIMFQKDSLADFLSAAQIQLLLAAGSQSRLDRMAKLLNEHHIHTLCILDDDYPDSLRDILDPPGILFWTGNLACLQQPRRLAMVGSRSASYAGLKATERIAKELTRKSVVIISGLAYGVDTESHRGCIEGGSPTVAVLGCGLDQTYPEKNLELKNSILQHGGLLLSEYAPEVRPIGYHFPYRNRIISGLGCAVVLMEARIRSGSLTTVDHALRQGKEVFAYPGDPTAACSDGNRSLLRDGARFFTTAQDILSDMNWLDNLPHVGQNSDCSVKSIPENGAETAVYKALENGTLSFEQILAVTGLSSAELSGILTIMQIKKMIDPLPGKKYQLTH